MSKFVFLEFHFHIKEGADEGSKCLKILTSVVDP